jgi:hypothetical protein
MKVGDVFDKVGSGIAGIVIGVGVLLVAAIFAWVGYRFVFVSGPILGSLIVFGLVVAGWVGGRNEERERNAKRQRALEREAEERRRSQPPLNS